MYIKDISNQVGNEITLNGWIANKRSGKGIHFIVLRDGSGFIQCIVAENEVSKEIFDLADQLSLESSVSITGKVVRDERQIGGFEIQASNLTLYQLSNEYPISKKSHGVDFLMDNRHLWLRSKKQWAIMKVRNQTIYAIHKFFQEEDFVQMDAPIFTGNACEGTSTLFETDYFGTPAYLSQSGQLYGEAMAMAMGKIYTFGPTFRAEKSKTRRHITEFWMIEPEMAFFDLNQDMDLIESFLKSVVGDVLENSKPELEILERDTTNLEKIAESTFPRVTYDDAVKILKGEMEVDGKNSIQTLEDDLTQNKKDIELKKIDIEEREAKIKQSGMKKGEINFNKSKIDTLKGEIGQLEEAERNIPQWIDSAKNFEYGSDFGGSDETVLTRLYDIPIMVYNWPHEVKAFYMKRDKDNPELAKGVDVLAPEGFGEIVGGAERETDLELLTEKIKEHDLPLKAFEWYLDLRRYGSVPHSGFGLGLERLVCWICKLDHIRESIPFARTYGRLLP
ncbi:MAG: asparagine--tRNA ligase [Bacteroidetes bacterium]|nr:MAG: asparagine--tRNA ligase [Bacteroidota bacterium]